MSDAKTTKVVKFISDATVDTHGAMMSSKSGQKAAMGTIQIPYDPYMQKMNTKRLLNYLYDKLELGCIHVMNLYDGLRRKEVKGRHVLDCDVVKAQLTSAITQGSYIISVDEISLVRRRNTKHALCVVTQDTEYYLVTLKDTYFQPRLTPSTVKSPTWSLVPSESSPHVYTLNLGFGNVNGVSITFDVRALPVLPFYTMMNGGHDKDEVLEFKNGVGRYVDTIGQLKYVPIGHGDSWVFRAVGSSTSIGVDHDTVAAILKRILEVTTVPFITVYPSQSRIGYHILDMGTTRVVFNTVMCLPNAITIMDSIHGITTYILESSTDTLILEGKRVIHNRELCKAIIAKLKEAKLME